MIKCNVLKAYVDILGQTNLEKEKFEEKLELMHLVVMSSRKKTHARTHTHHCLSSCAISWSYFFSALSLKCFSPLSSWSLSFYSSLPASPPQSFHWHFPCCLLHSRLLFYVGPSTRPSSVSPPHLAFSPHLWPSSALSGPDRHQGQGNILWWCLATAGPDMAALERERRRFFWEAYCKQASWDVFRYCICVPACICVCVWMLLGCSYVSLYCKTWQNKNKLAFRNKRPCSHCCTVCFCVYLHLGGKKWETGKRRDTKASGHERTAESYCTELLV